MIIVKGIFKNLEDIIGVIILANKNDNSKFNQEDDVLIDSYLTIIALTL